MKCQPSRTLDGASAMPAVDYGNVRRLEWAAARATCNQGDVAVWLRYKDASAAIAALIALAAFAALVGAES